MSLFNRLDHLLSQQDERYTSGSGLLSHLGVPSATIAVLENGQITSHIVTSISDNTSTRFQACSISKPIAALAIFRLIADGTLDLHAPISHYLAPADLALISTPETSNLVSSITLAQLLSHTSGLETSGSQGFPGYDPHVANPPPAIRDILAGKTPPVNTLRIELRAFPGQAYCYSGGGLTVVQLILETVTGQSFPDLMQRLVLDPLGMSDSTYRYPSDEDVNELCRPGCRADANYARAHHAGATPCEVAQRVNPEMAAAGLWSTPTDLLKAIRGVQASLDEETEANGIFLPRHVAQTMLEEVQNGLSHGWFVGDGLFGHGGHNEPGWRCFAVGSMPRLLGAGHLPAPLPPGCGIAVMTNSAQGVPVYWKIVAALCYLQGWAGLPVGFAHFAPTVAWVDPVLAVEEAWGREKSGFLGRWSGGWEVVEREGKPGVSFKGSPLVDLVVAAQPGGRGGGLCLRCKGLEVMFRVSTKPDEAARLEVWDGPDHVIKELRRID